MAPAKKKGLKKAGTTNPPFTLFQPIKTKRAFEEISGEIKKLIFKGFLRPGDRLPSESELAIQFHVGRQTIREALRLLELSGLITMQKGGAGGPLVVDTILNTISNSLLDAFQMKKISMDELTTARIEFEKIVMQYVLFNATESDLQALEETILEAKRNLKNRNPAFYSNMQFHKLLAKASKNHVFLIVMESIVAVIGDFRSQLGPDFDLSRKVVIEHENILKAIKKRSPKAIDLLERHLRYVGNRFKKELSV